MKINITLEFDVNVNIDFKKAKLCRGNNIKMGDSIASWSTLKGDDEIYIERLGCSVRGTCGRHCKGCTGTCYVNSSYNRYPSVKYGHAIRTLALRQSPEKVYETIYNQLKRARKPYTVVRVDQSGEIENVKQFRVFSRLAEDFPEITFYIYTKNYNVAVPELLAGNVPENFIINFSIWHEQGIKEFNLVKHLKNVQAFAYIDKDNSFDYEAAGLHIETMCTAYNSKGQMDHNITCEKCKKCFSGLYKVIGCNEH